MKFLWIRPRKRYHLIVSEEFLTRKIDSIVAQWKDLSTFKDVFVILNDSYKGFELFEISSCIEKTHVIHSQSLEIFKGTMKAHQALIHKKVLKIIQIIIMMISNLQIELLWILRGSSILVKYLKLQLTVLKLVLWSMQRKILTNSPGSRMTDIIKKLNPLNYVAVEHPSFKWMVSLNLNLLT